MHGELLPLGGGDPIPLLRTKLLVGRRDSCDIVLGFPNVSSHHTELELLNGYWLVRNLSHSNGTKVNGQRVDESYAKPGDTICFAKHCFEIQYTPDTTAPPPVTEEDPFAKSLLEKAGLAPRDRGRPPSERGAGKTTPPARPTVKPQPPKPPAQKDDHDRALEWLMGDDETSSKSAGTGP